MTQQAKIERLIQSYAETRRAMAKHINSNSTITKAQYEVLWQIKCGTHRVVDLANYLQISTSAATQLVQQLVESGHIKRQASPSDRRESVLSLSGSGKKVLDKFHIGLRRWAEDIASALNDDELNQYIEINNKIANHLKQTEAKT